MSAKKIISIVLIYIFICACRQNSGPCEYTINEIRAKVIFIEPYKEKNDTTQLYHIVMRLDESSLGGENQFLENLVPRIKGKTNAKFIELNHITVGNIFPGTVSELKKNQSKWTDSVFNRSSCQPVYVSFNFYFKTQ